MATNYPTSHRGIKLKWIKNEPKHKKGDKVIIFHNEQFIEITLNRVVKEKMKVEWLRACWGCRKPNPLVCDMFVYRWNKGLFTEGDEINPLNRLNELIIKVKELNSEIADLEKDAKLYQQIKSSLEGDLFEQDY